MQKEKRELRRDTEEKAHALEEAHKQLENIRASRQRVDQDIAVRVFLSLWVLSLFSYGGPAF